MKACCGEQSCRRVGPRRGTTQSHWVVAVVSTRPSPAERLSNPEALLSRTDLRELGLERRAVDAGFRELHVIVLPGYRRPLVRVCDS
jgi:hypothetical protein